MGDTWARRGHAVVYPKGMALFHGTPNDFSMINKADGTPLPDTYNRFYDEHTWASPSLSIALAHGYKRSAQMNQDHMYVYALSTQKAIRLLAAPRGQRHNAYNLDSAADFYFLRNVLNDTYESSFRNYSSFGVDREGTLARASPANAKKWTDLVRQLQNMLVNFLSRSDKYSSLAGTRRLVHDLTKDFKALPKADPDLAEAARILAEKLYYPNSNLWEVYREVMGGGREDVQALLLGSSFCEKYDGE